MTIQQAQELGNLPGHQLEIDGDRMIAALYWWASPLGWYLVCEYAL